MMEGIPGEVAASELCRHQGIHPTIYSTWLKDFVEADKGRMQGDTTREATSEEVRQLREENERLKQLVAELSPANLALKTHP
jgi:transposase